MSKKNLIITIVLSLFFLGSVFTVWAYSVIESQPKYSIESKPDPVILNEKLMWKLVNDWRKNQGKAEYVIDENLCSLADIRVSEIKTNWSHEGFKERGSSGSDELYSTGFINVGENLAQSTDGWSDENSLFYNWLNSPSHKENLDKDYSHSCVKCEDNYCVQLFGKY